MHVIYLLSIYCIEYKVSIMYVLVVFCILSIYSHLYNEIVLSFDANNNNFWSDKYVHVVGIVLSSYIIYKLSKSNNSV